MKTKKQSGFTLIEVMIALIVGSILVVFIASAFGLRGPATGGDVHFTVNGTISEACIGGYKVIKDTYGTRQIMDEFGHGVRCGEGK